MRFYTVFCRAWTNNIEHGGASTDSVPFSLSKNSRKPGSKRNFYNFTVNGDAFYFKYMRKWNLYSIKFTVNLHEHTQTNTHAHSVNTWGVTWSHIYVCDNFSPSQSHNFAHSLIPVCDRVESRQGKNRSKRYCTTFLTQYIFEVYIEWRVERKPTAVIWCFFFFSSVQLYTLHVAYTD